MTRIKGLSLIWLIIFALPLFMSSKNKHFSKTWCTWKWKWIEEWTYFLFFLSNFYLFIVLFLLLFNGPHIPLTPWSNNLFLPTFVQHSSGQKETNHQASVNFLFYFICSFYLSSFTAVFSRLFQIRVCVCIFYFYLSWFYFP